MTDSGKAWFGGLQTHIKNLRKQMPISPRDELSDDDEWECRIVGSTLIRWLQEVGPSFLRERSVLYKIREIEPDPYIVFTSNMAGLVAANEIVGPVDERIVYLLESEFEDWAERNPDAEYRWHVHVWSQFQPTMKPEFAERAVAAYSSVDQAALRQHSEGTIWATLAGRGVDHLWKWQPGKPELLEEAFGHWLT